MINMEQVVEKKITPNAAQSECIKTLDGPVMVLAGPGTGKTFTIIRRIEYMLASGIAPETVLCLTYSEAAANEMKARLVKEIGTAASALTVNTYHAFCSDLIKQYPAEFELLDGVGLADDITRRTLMKEALDEFKPEAYRTKWGDAYYFIPELLGNVDELKKNRITHDKYSDILENHPQWGLRTKELEAGYKEREAKGKPVKTFLGSVEAHKRKIDKAKETWEIYEIYERKLKQNNFIDFNDMINLVLESFDNSDFLRRAAGKYKYFLVDEYQDTNYAQNEIVFKLSEGSGTDNIFVVGDDDQIIYEFQGARTDTPAKFLRLYPETKVICLSENNRSTQTILDLSYALISQDTTRLEFNPDFAQYNISKKMIAKNHSLPENKARLHCFANVKQEDNFIVEKIEALSQKLADLSQIAVLTRENGELRNFAELLEAKNIPYQLKTSKSIFELKPSILTYFYLKVLKNHEFYSDKLFGLLLSKPFDFELADYNFLLEQNRLNHKDFITNIRGNYDRKWANKIKVMNFLTVFDDLKEFCSRSSLKNIVVQVINKTGILEYFTAAAGATAGSAFAGSGSSENVFALKRIVDEAAAFMNLRPAASLEDFISHLDMAFEAGIPIDIDKDEYTQNAVQLLTLHGAKGREFEYVFMPHLTSRKWENKRSGSAGTALPLETEVVDSDAARKSEQLRLLFVGITRAKHSLCLSYSNVCDGQPQELTGYLPAALCESSVHELDDEEYANEIWKSLSCADFDCRTAFKNELAARVEKFILSPSTLNCYLNCPRNFLYTYILKIPVQEQDWWRANYGSAIHKTLENAVCVAKETGKYPVQEAFLEDFVKNLGVQRFDTQAKRTELEARGKDSLAKFYPHFVQTSPDRIERTEFHFHYVPVGDYFVNGAIDRVEANADGTYSLYDYKTGSAKPKSQIAEGREYESYLNQLRFYKLAFEALYPGKKISQAGLIFVEEVEGSYYAQLTQEDNDNIRVKILNAYKGIRALEFGPSEKADCGFCAYKQMCRLNLF